MASEIKAVTVCVPEHPNDPNLVLHISHAPWGTSVTYTYNGTTATVTRPVGWDANGTERWSVDVSIPYTGGTLVSWTDPQGGTTYHSTQIVQVEVACPAPSTTTTVAPVTTVPEATTTTAPPSTTVTSTTLPATTTTNPPVRTTSPPVVTTVPPSTTSTVPETTTSLPPVVTTAPPTTQVTVPTTTTTPATSTTAWVPVSWQSPSTGSDPSPLLNTGVLFCLMGVAAVLVTRRRRPRPV